jgi:hypothetical protein
LSPPKKKQKVKGPYLSRFVGAIVTIAIGTIVLQQVMETINDNETKR